MRLPWDDWEVDNPEIQEVAEKFVMANCYNQQAACSMLHRDEPQRTTGTTVPGIGKPDTA